MTLLALLQHLAFAALVFVGTLAGAVGLLALIFAVVAAVASLRRVLRGQPAQAQVELLLGATAASCLVTAVGCAWLALWVRGL